MWAEPAAPGVAVLGPKWDELQTWLQSMGFKVVRDHSTYQYGSTCGIVAARVSSLLKDSHDEFMSANTVSAVDWDVIEEANTNVLHRTSRDTSNTLGSQVESLATHYNEDFATFFFTEKSLSSETQDTLNIRSPTTSY